MKTKLTALLALGVLLVGCGEKTISAEPVTNAEPKVAAKKPEPPNVEPKKPEPPKTTSEKLIADPIVEAAIRERLKKPTGELTKADLEKVTWLHLEYNQLTSVKVLEKLTQLTRVTLDGNQLTNVKGLEKLTQLTLLQLASNKLTDVKGLEKLRQLKKLDLKNNPDLTKAQIDELQKALPKCDIRHRYAK